MSALQGLSWRLYPFARALPRSNVTRWSSPSHRRELCTCVSSSHRALHVLAPLLWSSPSRPFSQGRGADKLKVGSSEQRNIETLSEYTVFLEGNDGTEFSVDGGQTDGSEGILVSEYVSEDWRQGKASEDREYSTFGQKEMTKREVQAPNYLTMSDSELFSKCRMDTYRASGPGGQHRNKTESAVRLTHIPTGLVSQAAEDRSQHVNRAHALTRMRQVIAQEIRSPVELECYKAPPELVRILPNLVGVKRGNSQKIGPNHPDFVLGMKALLDLLWTVGGSVSEAGAILGISTGALSKLILSSNALWQAVNKLRSLKGLKPLR